VDRHDDEKLRRFVRCRDAGDPVAAHRWWAELVCDNADRVRAMVGIWGRDGRLSSDEQEEAVQTAFIKLWRNTAGTFRGSSMGEWVNAVKQCAEYACLDVQRTASRHRAHEASLDEVRGDDDGEAGRHDRAAAERAREEHARVQERADARDFLAWALPQVEDPRRRTVIERTLDGVPGAEIAAELGVTMANLYQLRRRGLDDLARLKERYDP
jgi:RNA polymerase sigma factor (sigma-70 family)